MLTSNKMSIGMENNIEKVLGLFLPLPSLSLFDAPEILARFLADGKAFIFWVPFFCASGKDYERDPSHLSRKRHIRSQSLSLSSPASGEDSSQSKSWSKSVATAPLSSSFSEGD